MIYAILILSTLLALQTVRLWKRGRELKRVEDLFDEAIATANEWRSRWCSAVVRHDEDAILDAVDIV
jgi:hypothetical protein